MKRDRRRTAQWCRVHARLVLDPNELTDLDHHVAPEGAGTCNATTSAIMLRCGRAGWSSWVCSLPSRFVMLVLDEEESPIENANTLEWLS